MKTHFQWRPSKSIIFFPHLLWLLAIGLVLSSATQAQITVTSTADSGPGSLRQAIVDASSGNTINITVTGTITLTTGQLVIDKDLTITGPGASQLTISGNNATRVFFINPGAAGATTGPPSGNLIVTIKELTIANGRATGGNGRNGGGAGGGAAGMGGALFINRGTVAVDHVSFTGNQAVGGTGGRGGYGTGGSGGGGGGFGGNGNRIEIGGEGGALGGSGGTYVYQANGGSGGDGAGGGGGGCCNGELGGSGGFGGGGGGGASSGTSTGGGGGFGGFGGGGGGGGGTDGDGGISAAGGTFGGTGGSQVGTYNDGGGGGGGGLGGAIFIRAGSITVTQSSFTGNQATPGVGGLAKNGTASGTAGQGKGGAIFILNAGATASISANTTYSNNTATDAGSVTTDNANTYGTFSTCAAFTATLTPSGQLTCANSTVTLMAGGGLAGATYQYSAGATNNGSTATVMADGPYSVTVTNPGGCSSTATTTVMSNTTVPTVSITPSMTAICAGQTATFTASGSPASYSWSSGQTTASISATAQGPYSVTATSTDNGCVATATATLTVNPLPTPSITNLNAAYCKDATAVPLTGTPPSGGVFTIDGTTATTFNPANLSTGQHTVVYSYTNANGCSNTAIQMVTIKEVPQMPTITTRSGGPYPGGFSSLTISQNTGNVILGVSGCTGGTLTWSGGNSNTLAVSTANTGVQTFTATCTANGCTSPLVTATVTVVAPTLRVFSRDPDNGQLGNNTIKPYLLLQNAGNTPINYSTITLRYWLTTENNIPLIFQKNYVQIGQNNVQLRYVPLATPRQGATGYIEYSFQPGAGSLAPMGDSGPLEVQANKQDYSVFDQRDDYSYVNNNSAYMLNPRITAYQNGVIFYGTEPGAGARRGVEETGKLTVQVLGNPVTGSTISVSVGGAEGQVLRYELTDVSGHVVGERQVESAGAVEQQLLWVGHQPAGLFLLRVSTPTQNQTVKVLRQ